MGADRGPCRTPTVEHSESTVDAYVIGDGLNIRSQPHGFAKEDRFCSLTAACETFSSRSLAGRPSFHGKRMSRRHSRESLAKRRRGFRARESFYWRESTVLQVICACQVR